jgi:hypothetical protein
VYHPALVTAPCATFHIAPLTTLTRYGRVWERSGPLLKTLLLWESEGGRPFPTAPFLAPFFAVAIAPCATRSHCAVYQLSYVSHFYCGRRVPPNHGAVPRAKPLRRVPPKPLRRAVHHN